MSRCNTAVIIFLLLLSFGVPHAAQSADYLNLVGKEGTNKSKLPALQLENEWLLDLYQFFQSLDFQVQWDSDINRLQASNKSRELRFRPDTERVLIDGRKLSLIDPPLLKNGRLFMRTQAVVNLVNKYTDQSLIWNSSRKQLQVANPAAWAQNKKKDPIGSLIENVPDRKEDQLLVIIDPGHGGRDPGAIGYNGLKEKKVVLEISRAIKNELEQEYPKIKPRLTRNRDEFIPLSQRTQIANQMEGDVFVSLHANANRSQKAKGFEVYTLSGEATSPSGKELAKIENSALRYEGYKKSELDDISFILNQLRNSVHVRESRTIAQDMMERAQRQLPIPTRRARQAPFWVLKDARMPAMLVETGFLSNPTEERILQKESYQQAVAKVIASSLSKYRKQRQ